MVNMAHSLEMHLMENGEIRGNKGGVKAIGSCFKDFLVIFFFFVSRKLCPCCSVRHSTLFSVLCRDALSSSLCSSILPQFSHFLSPLSLALSCSIQPSFKRPRGAPESGAF